MLAVCCVIQNLSCLFLITYLTVPEDAAGVLVEKNKTWTQPFQRGGRNVSVFVMNPLYLLQPHRPRLKRGTSKNFLPLLLLRTKASGVGMSSHFPSASFTINATMYIIFF